MAFGKFEDLSDTCELIVFPDVFSKNENLLKSEKPLLLGGNLETEGSLAKVIVDTVTLLEESWTHSKSLRVRLEKVKQAEFAALNSIFKEHPGNALVHFSLLLAEQNKELEMEPEEKIKVALNHDFFENIQKHFGRTDFLELGSG
jgi:DNA polymerase III alpha subunit